MKLYRKKGMDCRQKATFIPLYLKSKVQNQGEEDERYEHYLVFLENREESRSFDVFLCFLGEKYGEKRERERKKKSPERCLNSSQNVSLQSKLPGAFYKPQHAFWGPVHLVAVLSQAQLTLTISSSCTFSVLMSSFQKTKETEIPIVGSKVMTS